MAIYASASYRVSFEIDRTNLTAQGLLNPTRSYCRVQRFLNFQPPAPVRRGDVADVGDSTSTELWRVGGIPHLHVSDDSLPSWTWTYSTVTFCYPSPL